MTKSEAKQNGRRVEIDSQTGRKIINTWISNIELERFSLVINNKRSVSLQSVKSVRIHSSFYKLPFSVLTSYYLFNSPSLEELELVLKMFSAIKVPTISVHFGHLKLLKFYGIFFTIVPTSECMILCLPLLKKFDIKNCSWSSGKDLIVQAPLLENISIEQDYKLCNMVSSHGSPSQAIKFNGSDIKQFTYSGCGISQLIHWSIKVFCLLIQLKSF